MYTDLLFIFRSDSATMNVLFVFGMFVVVLFAVSKLSSSAEYHIKDIGNCLFCIIIAALSGLFCLFFLWLLRLKRLFASKYEISDLENLQIAKL